MNQKSWKHLRRLLRNASEDYNRRRKDAIEAWHRGSSRQFDSLIHQISSIAGVDLREYEP